jgi:NodT family efflux transporter outer membrane factor (OMF) lipoprotein
MIRCQNLSFQKLKVCLTLLGTVVAFTGCTVGPKYQKPVMPSPPAFKELAGNDQWKTATPSDAALKGKWWEVFNDPQLNKLEELINVDNNNVKQAEAQFRQARSVVLINHSGYYPVIGSSPSISQSDRGSNAGGRGTSANFQIPFSATWEPDLWGRVRLAVENSVANAQVFAADLENIRLSLQATLAADYFALLANDMELNLLKDTLAGYEKYLTLTINRFNGGVASKADVTLAQTQLFTTQAQATDLDVQRNQLEHAIAVLIGQPPSALTIPRGKIETLPPAIPTALPSQLLERRPDIAAQERLVAAANANVGIAEVAFYPTLTLSATAGLSSPNLQNLFTWASRVWSTGPVLSQTLFDFGTRDARILQAKAAYDGTIAAYRQTVLTAFQQVEDNLSALRVLSQESQQQAKAIDAAQQSLQLVTERYKAGTESYLNVITTQLIALSDERAAVTLTQRRMTAAVNLILALGGGWDSSTLPTADQLRTVEMGDPANTKRVAQPRPETN